MFGRVRALSVSNGRIAWVVAGASLAAILAMPSPVAAQIDRPAGVAPSAATPSGQTGARPTSRRSSVIDILDVRDATANTMVIAQPPAPAGAEPLAINAVICVAGCDRGPGSVVYRDRQLPTLASIGAPVAIETRPTSGINPPPNGDAKPAGSPLSCLAGCYDPPTGRTVASLQAQHARPMPQPVVRAKAPILTDAPPVIAKIDEPAAAIAAEIEKPAKPAKPAKPVKLRTAFAADGTIGSVKRSSARNRTAKIKAKAKVAGHHYGKVVPVPTAKTLPPPEPVAAKSKPAETTSLPAAPAEPAPPVSTFTPARKTEKKKADKPRSDQVSSASNDWFNRINRERKAKDAEKSGN